MEPANGQGIINANEYDLAASSQAFVEAIDALARRTKSEGHPGVEAYRWFFDDDAGTAGAIIVYKNAAAWVGHHELAYKWDEMAALQATVSLRRLTLFGPLSNDLTTWLSNANLSYIHYPTWAAGF